MNAIQRLVQKGGEIVVCLHATALKRIPITTLLQITEDLLAQAAVMPAGASLEPVMKRIRSRPHLVITTSTLGAVDGLESGAPAQAAQISSSWSWRP